MASSRDASISLGRWDPFHRTPSLLVKNGRVKFIPGTGTYGEFDQREADFPSGARLEYRVQKGDRFFDGDHSQALGRALWVLAPDGSKSLLASGFVLYMSLAVAARNLKEQGIFLRAVSFYEGKDGKVVEQEISIPKQRVLSTAGLLLGLSGVWLGVLAGIFIHSLAEIIAVGAIAFAIRALIEMRFAFSKRVSFVTIASMLFTYTANYSAVIVLVRALLAESRGR